MGKLLRAGLGFLFGLVIASSTSWATDCTAYYNSSLPVFTGYGASYDVFNPGFPQFLAEDCNQATVPATIGTGASNSAVWGTAYVSTVSVPAWTPVTLTSFNPVVLNGYFQGLASGNLNISSSDLSSGWNYVAFLVAVYRNGSWVYGCPDVACTSPGWNMQALTTNAVMPTINTISFSTPTIHVPASPGSNVGSFSVTLSTGSFAGTIALSTSGSCAGSPSADNSKFVISGSGPFLLNVGGTTVNDITDNVCVSVTDATTANSPEYFPFLLTGDPPRPPTPVSVSLAPSTTTLNDTSLTGTLVSTVTVHMSDGTTNYSGSISSDNPLFSISGFQVILSRDLAPSDDGTTSVHVSVP